MSSLLPSVDRSDAELWLSASSGTNGSFGLIFDRYQVRLLRSSWRHTEDQSLAEDAVAITFLELWRLRDKVRIVDDSLLPWLLAVNANVCRNLKRSHRRYARLLSRIPQSESAADAAVVATEHLEQLERARLVQGALGKLAKQDRTIVELCMLEGLAQTVVAETLNIPLGTVKSRLFRAKARMKTILRESIPADELKEVENAGTR